MANVVDSGSGGQLNPGFGGGGPVAVPNVIARKTSIACSLGDAFSAQVSYGFDKLSGEARIVMPEQQGNIGDSVSLSMGAGNNFVRFSGTIRQFDTTLAPHAVTAVCKGPAYAVEEYKNPEESQDLDTTRRGLMFEDLVGTTTGATLQQIVSAVLGRVGVGFTTSGTMPSHLYGLQAPEEFLWGTGQSAAEFLHRVFEASAGYRLFDSSDGNIYLEQVSGIPSGADLTLTLGQDILSNSTSSNSSLGLQTAVLVEGWDDGSGPATSGIVGSGSAFHVGSTMIEDDAFAVSLANFWLPVVNRNQQLVKVETPRDDLIGPGSTVLIDATRGLGVSQTLWVRSVITEVTANGTFTQQLTCISE